MWALARSANNAQLQFLCVCSSGRVGDSATMQCDNDQLFKARLGCIEQQRQEAATLVIAHGCCALQSIVDYYTTISYDNIILSYMTARWMMLAMQSHA